MMKNIKITEKSHRLEELPSWQKNIIDQRLELYRNHPERVMPVEQFFELIDKEEEGV